VAGVGARPPVRRRTGARAHGEETMDDQRFDDLARALAAGTDRRRALAGLAGAALALLGAGGAAAEREKPMRRRHRGVRVRVENDNTNVAFANAGGGGGGGGGGEPCNQTVCGPGEFCCNFSCSICAPDGGACIQEFCG